VKILRIDSSALIAGSKGRMLGNQLLDALAGSNAHLEVTERDLARSIPHVDQAWIAANDTVPHARSAAQNAALMLSDTLIAELEAADTIVLTVPLYNFTIPASLKAWIDQVCRFNRTFRYDENGAVGMLTGKRAVVVFVSGGTPLGSGYDFASAYLRHILGFIGIADVTFIAADAHLRDEAVLTRAAAGIDSFMRQLSA
jgi:FMN-dependent NADH-azoreductase